MEWTYLLLILNALVGLAIFEYSWASTKKMRREDSERDKDFPWYKRLDAPKWNKLAMYPFALTIMPLRLFVFTGLMLFVCIFNATLLIGVKKDEPIPMIRKKFMHFFFKYFAGAIAVIIGMII